MDAFFDAVSVRQLFVFFFFPVALPLLLRFSLFARVVVEVVVINSHFNTLEIGRVTTNFVREMASPSFDVQGFSGCPLRVFSAPSWAAVAALAQKLNGASPPSTSSAEGTDRYRHFVEKTSSSVAYNKRLQKQAEKQQEFSALLAKADGVVVPPIAFVAASSVSDAFDQERRGADGNARRGDAVLTEDQQKHQQLASVVMPFVHHTDALRFLCAADMGRLARFELRLKRFFEWTVRNSPMQPLPLAVIVAKLRDLQAVCSAPSSLLRSLVVSGVPQVVGAMGSDSRPPPSSSLTETSITTTTTTTATTMSDASSRLIGALITYFERSDIRDLRIPMGRCHGDLTLSNVLIQESADDAVVLIDFLDSFLESPLADMAKINQDLGHAWTLRMLSKRDATVDPVRLFTLFRRLMGNIVLVPFGTELWFRRLFRPMCIVSQMRVLQYSTSESAARYLWHTIELECQEMMRDV